MSNQIKFHGSGKPTIGVELELFTVNNENLSLSIITSLFKNMFIFLISIPAPSKKKLFLKIFIKTPAAESCGSKYCTSFKS